MIPSFDDQVKWGLALPILLVAALLQLALAPILGVLGGHGDLFLVLVAGWALIRSPEEVMIAGPPSALLAGLLGAGPIGVPILALMVPIGMAMLLRAGGAMPRLPSLVATVALSSAAAVMLDLVVQFLSGARSLDLAGFGTVLAGATALNVFLATVIYWPLRVGRQRKLVRRTHLSLS
jgi:hypothetical protein